MTQIKVFHIAFNDGSQCFEFALSYDDVWTGNDNVKAVFEVYA